MLLRITGDRRNAQVISIPRDSWVTIPGHGRNKINAAYAFGGPSLLIQTVEALTNVRVDHFGVIDFAGFKTMTDALGGVDVAVNQQTSSRGVTFTEGMNHLNGDQALVYVRQRYELAGGDFDREQRQQNYLRAMLTTASQGNLLGSPGKLDDFIRALTGSVSAKDLVTLAFGSRDLKPGSVAFLTAPVTGTGMEGDQSVVYLDDTADAALWRYLNNDSLAQHVAQFKQLPATPN
jgi:LCP family protein required for cell wall assembly